MSACPLRSVQPQPTSLVSPDSPAARTATRSYVLYASTYSTTRGVGWQGAAGHAAHQWAGSRAGRSSRRRTQSRAALPPAPAPPRAQRSLRVLRFQEGAGAARRGRAPPDPAKGRCRPPPAPPARGSGSRRPAARAARLMRGARSCPGPGREQTVRRAGLLISALVLHHRARAAGC